MNERWLATARSRAKETAIYPVANLDHVDTFARSVRFATVHHPPLIPMVFASILLTAAAIAAPSAPLPHASPALASRPSGPGIEQVQIATEDKVMLAGALYTPKAAKHAAPAALLIHDAGGSRADLKDMADRLHKQGFVVLSIDLRGHGESVEAGDWAKLDEDARKSTWAASLGDVKAGMSFLRSQEGVQAASLTVIGYRAGCTLVARYAVRDESVQAIALLDPQSEQFGFNVMKDIEGLGGLPTFVIVGKGDERNGQRLTDAAARATDGKGDKAVQIFTSKESTGTTLTDKRASSEAVKWLTARVAPKRGSS